MDQLGVYLGLVDLRLGIGSAHPWLCHPPEGALPLGRGVDWLRLALIPHSGWGV